MISHDTSTIVRCAPTYRFAFANVFLEIWLRFEMFWHSIWVAEDWHPAVVESILDDGRLKLIFIEHQKQQIAEGM